MSNEKSRSPRFEELRGTDLDDVSGGRTPPLPPNYVWPEQRIVICRPPSKEQIDNWRQRFPAR